MAEKTHSEPETVASETSLDIPKDIGRRLDKYAAALGGEYLFPVSRQQAWERLARTFLPKEGGDA